MNTKDLRRFTRKYINTGPAGCWLWLNGKNHSGYGIFHLDGKQQKAHRVAYEHYVGVIPAGLELDHLCRHRGCVNPAHLEAVTHAENVRRGGNSLKTHCPKGHEYKDNNLLTRSNGKRDCLTCHRERNRGWRARKAGV